MDDPGLRIRRDGAALHLVLDRPERRNALSTALRDALSDAIDGVAADESVRVVVISATGPVFCAGFDLKKPYPYDGPLHKAAMNAVYELQERLGRYECAVLVAGHGQAEPGCAAGDGGLGLVQLHGDLRKGRGL